MIFLFPRWDMLIPWRVFFSWSPSAGRDLWFLERRLRRIRPPRTRWDHAFAVGCSLERKRMEHRGVQIFLGGLFFFLPEWNLWMSSILVVEPSKTRSTYHSKQGSSKRFQAGVGLLFFWGGVYFWLVPVYGTFSHFLKSSKRNKLKAPRLQKSALKGGMRIKSKRESETWTFYPVCFLADMRIFRYFLTRQGFNAVFVNWAICCCDRSCVASLHRSSFLWSVGHLATQGFGHENARFLARIFRA